MDEAIILSRLQSLSDKELKKLYRTSIGDFARMVLVGRTERRRIIRAKLLIDDETAEALAMIESVAEPAPAARPARAAKKKEQTK